MIPGKDQRSRKPSRHKNVGPFYFLSVLFKRTAQDKQNSPSWRLSLYPAKTECFH